MKIAMMQPTFLPWLGVFELIFNAERFIFLDDFQFSLQSYHQRNRLFLDRNQVGWYTVPVMKSVSFLSPLNQTRISESPAWRGKMWKRIVQNYSKAPFFDALSPQVKAWLLTPAPSLAEQNISFILSACEVLGLRREFLLSSQCPSAGKRSERVLQLLEWCEADRYLCARGAFDYMKADAVFPVRDIEILFQNFEPAPYPQIGSADKFVPFLSSLDALFNIGAQATWELIQKGTKKWLTWGDLNASCDNALGN